MHYTRPRNFSACKQRIEGGEPELCIWQAIERRNWPRWVIGMAFGTPSSLRTAARNKTDLIYQGRVYEYRVTPTQLTPGHWGIERMERRPKPVNEDRESEAFDEEEDEEEDTYQLVGEGDCENCGREDEELYDWNGMAICYDCLVLAESDGLV